MAELTGKAISELPAATTINDTDLLALSQNGASKKITPPVLLSEVESEISGLNNSLATYVRPNLLDNWYFVRGSGSVGAYGSFPVNQRGQASYSAAGFTIDRLKKVSGNGTVYSIAQGLQFSTSDSDYAYFIFFGQDVPSWMTATYSILTNLGITTVRTGGSPVTLPSGILVYIDSRRLALRIPGNLSQSNSETFIAAKVEIGSTQTLAHQENGVWVLNEIPNFADELARCKRYYSKFPVETYLSGVYRPVEGIIRLTINESVNQNVSLGMTEFYVWTEAGGIQGSYVPTSIARTYWSPTAFTVDITSSFTLAAWTPVTLTIVNGTINADL